MWEGVAAPHTRRPSHFPLAALETVAKGNWRERKRKVCRCERGSSRAAPTVSSIPDVVQDSLQFSLLSLSLLNFYPSPPLSTNFDSREKEKHCHNWLREGSGKAEQRCILSPDESFLVFSFCPHRNISAQLRRNKRSGIERCFVVFFFLLAHSPLREKAKKEKEEEKKKKKGEENRNWARAMADETSSASSAFSPLSGGYLLIVLSEPHSEQHKQVLLEHLAKGQSSLFCLNFYS